MRFLRALLGTLIAVFAGWFAGVLGVAVIAFSGIGGAQRDAALEGILVTAFYMWLFIIPVWVVALIPLYLFIPPSSPLWRPYICTGLGAVAGLAIVAILTRADMAVEMWSFYILAAIVGGVTCLTGVLTRARFGPNHLTNRWS
jgi:hypothetical protein